MSDDSDNTNKNEKRCKRPLKAASSTDSSDSGSPLAVTKRSRKQLVVASDDDSSSSEDEEIIAIRPAIRRGVLPVLSDNDSGTSIAGDDSGSESEGNLSDVESSPIENAVDAQNKLDDRASGSSSESDGQSERCPICLIKFVSQEVGTPESCDHFFCAACIQEWSKNVNTCPVDRQPYKLILIREHLDGKVIRQVPVHEAPCDQKHQEEDNTFCEICSQSNREETLLLCDGCDNGYHMECLDPPLAYVPIEEWYCPECAPRYRRVRNQSRSRRHQGDEPEGDEEEEDRDDDFVPISRFRLVPRTRQAERVRRNVQRNNISPHQFEAPEATTSSGGQRFFASVRTRATARATHRTRRQSRRTGVRIKRIVTDDGIIEVILKCKKKGRKRKGRKKKRSRQTVSSPRSAKGRLAARLGMCKPKMTRQTIPESVNRQEISSAPINHQRHQAGIPTLDLFGRREHLDYFSGSDPEDDVGSIEGGTGILSRVRVARPRDQLLNRKKAASILTSTSSRKPLRVDKLSSPAGSSLLDSILVSQTLWHSKKTEIKSNADGTLKVIPKCELIKEESKVDVKKTTAPAKSTPMFSGGRPNSGAFKVDSSNQGGASQSGSRSYGDQSEERSYQPSAPTSIGFSRSEGPLGTGPSPLRGVAPIRFRMNIPPRRPNIHSYPSDNIPPPPPLRLRSPMADMPFPSNNSPEPSPEREEEDVDIYSDIEQESSTVPENEERTFTALEPPPEPPFLMTMEPPPEPPALLMNLNDDASDDEPSGLVIDDPPTNDVYDPCAANSDDSSTEDLPVTQKKRDLVANYSSDSSPTQGSGSYNPELPTYSSTPIIGPLPRPASHNSSEVDDNEEECPNFSLYSATSMKLAHRGLDLDIPIPPPIEKENHADSMDIPLPSDNLPSSNDINNSEDIPLPPTSTSSPSPDRKSDVDDTRKSPQHQKARDSDKGSESNYANKLKGLTDRDPEEKSFDDIEEGEDDGDDEKEDDEDAAAVEEEVDDNSRKDMDNVYKHEENQVVDEDKNSLKSEYECGHEDDEKIFKTKSIKNKDSEAGEDECSTQGDVLDLVIESEANLENNMPHDDNEEQKETTLNKSPVRLEESDDKFGDGGDKSDGLVDITDEEMSVYDAQDNSELEKLSEQIRKSIQDEKELAKSLVSDDDNSLVGGATSAVSAASFNDSDNLHSSTLPGLEGLETETISESEDVNFDELPLENQEQCENVTNEDDLSSSRKKKKKKSRKMSQNEETSTKANNEPLEFEEGEIVEDRPKKDKRSKPKTEAENEVDENIDCKKQPVVEKKQSVAEKEKETSDKKTKKKKEKGLGTKEKPDKIKEKELKEKTLKSGEPDENISWKKLSKSTKERNYRDGKEKDDKVKEKEKDKNRENKEESSRKKNRERRKELERYDVRRLISEKPKQPKKDEFGRDISPSSSDLSPYRPPRYRSPLRTRNRSRTRSRSVRSQSRSRDKKRRSRSRERIRPKTSRTRERSRRRSRSQNRVSSRSRDKRRSPEKTDRARVRQRSLSIGRRKTRSRSHHSHHSKKHRSSYSKSWTPSWSRSSMSRSRSPHYRRSKSITRSRSRSWSRGRVPSLRGVKSKEPPKNLTVIVPNKDALKKKEKKKMSRRKDDRRKKKRGQSPAPSKEVFTSGDNILVSVNFKNANKNPEIIPATTPLLRESSKRKRDEVIDGSAKKKKSVSSTKKTPGKKSNRLAKINEAAKNVKPVAIIDLDVSPFRAQTPSPKEVIVLSDSGDEGEKHSEMQDEISRMGHSGLNQSMLSLSSIDHGQKNSVSQPESPVSSFMHNSSGPKTPPEPHIKFSISTKQSQMRMLNNPLMEAEEEMQDDNIGNEVNEIMHKGPNTPPEPPPEMTTPASPPTTPYDPFDPTKSRSPSPQPRSDPGSQLNTSREDKLENVQITTDDHLSLNEPRTQTPTNEMEETKKTPEPPKVHSTPKNDTSTELSPKVSPPTGLTEPKVTEDSLMQPIKKLLADANKLNVTVHKSPEKLITVVISQQTKNQNQTPKQPVLPLKAITPNKQLTPKTNSKHQFFSSNLVKQVPILGTLLPGPPIYTPSSGLSNSKVSNRSQQNGDTFEDMDIDPSSPYSPGSSEGDDLFEPPITSPPRSSSKPSNKSKPTSGNKFDALFGSSPAKNRHGRYSSKSAKKSAKPKSKGSKKEEVKVKLDEDQLKILDDLPSSAVEMQVKDKFLKKLNRQERVVEEVKLVLKPHYAKKHVNKEEYKEILRRAVPKICHNKSGEINPIKIQHLIEAYVKKFRYAKKKAAGAIPPPVAQNKPKPQKTLWS